MQRFWSYLFLIYTYTLAHVAGQLAMDGVHLQVPPMCENVATSGITQNQDEVTIGNNVDNERIVNSVLALLSGTQNQTATLETFYYNTSGLYLMNDSIPSAGYLNRVEAFGYLPEDLVAIIAANRRTAADDENFPLPVVPILYVTVYRPDHTRGEYVLVHGPKNITHGFNLGVLELDATAWPVEEGDRIGVLIPDMCINMTDTRFCPAQVNLRPQTNDCVSALYYSGLGDNSVIDMDKFDQVYVNLSALGTITLRDEPTGNVNTILVAVPLVVIASLLTLFVLIFAIWKRRRQKLAASKEPKKHEIFNRAEMQHEYEYVSGYNAFNTIPRAASYTYPSVVQRTTSSTADGYDHDDGYEQPFFQPANKEEELISQVNMTLAVPTIPHEHLKLTEVVGSGAFATVYKGVWSQHHIEIGQLIEEEVAVKKLKSEVSEEERVKFLQEAAIMAQFKHANIVAIRGIVIEEPMMIMVDLIRGGDLRHYLLTTVRKSSPCDPLELGSTLLSYTRQIALGLAYLGNKSFVHRDLAARNVLVSADGRVCKISDFGLSRDLQQADFYVSHGGKIPVKWTAPEALKYRKYSLASDVWSYGCVLYEIWSLGEKLFKDTPNQETIRIVEAGYRLPPPPGCPRAIYHLMIKCWHPDSEERSDRCYIIQQLLQLSDFHILKWTAEDKDQYSEGARTLGAPLHLGEELYSELQESYLPKIENEYS